MTDSESDEQGYEPDNSLRRLKSILYDRRPSRSVAGPLQRLGESAGRHLADGFEDALVIDVPRALQEMSLGDVAQQPLDITGHETLLTEQTSIVIEDRRREIQNTQKRLDRALQELAVVKRKEEELLVRRVAELEREFASGLKELQRQFVAQAEELKRDVINNLGQQRRQCEMTVETKARALSASLATTRKTSRSPSPAARESVNSATPFTTKPSTYRFRTGGRRPESEKVGTYREGFARAVSARAGIGRLGCTGRRGVCCEDHSSVGPEEACSTPLTPRSRRWKKTAGGHRRDMEESGRRSGRRDLLQLIDSDEEDEW